MVGLDPTISCRKSRLTRPEVLGSPLALLPRMTWEEGGRKRPAGSALAGSPLRRLNSSQLRRLPRSAPAWRSPRRPPPASLAPRTPLPCASLLTISTQGLYSGSLSYQVYFQLWPGLLRLERRTIGRPMTGMEGQAEKVVCSARNAETQATENNARTGAGDTTLTPPRAQYGATQGKAQKRNRLRYAVFVSPCNPQQRMIITRKEMRSAVRVHSSALFFACKTRKNEKPRCSCQGLCQQ